jgi:hypothetical protein
MTKSKGVGRGGHRKGAGRPRFAQMGKTSYFSTRITPKTRSLLEAEARRRGKSLSEVAEDLLQLGLEEMADLDRPKPIRALLFMISSLARGILGPHWQDAKYSWRSNPYMFATLRAGVVDLLDGLQPAGEIVTPPPGPEEERWADWDEEGNEGSAGYLWRYTFPDSPQEYARILVQSLVLQAQMSARSASQSRATALPRRATIRPSSHSASACLTVCAKPGCRKVELSSGELSHVSYGSRPCENEI